MTSLIESRRMSFRNQRVRLIWEVTFSLSLFHTQTSLHTQLLLDISIRTQFGQDDLCLLVLNPNPFKKESQLRTHEMLVCLFIYVSFFWTLWLDSIQVDYSGVVVCHFRRSRSILKCSVKRHTPHCRPSKTSPLSPPQKCL